MDPDDLDTALSAVGELLASDGFDESIVVVGGAALSLLGLVPRATRDVDVIARALNSEPDAVDARRPMRLVRPDPLPDHLVRAVATVARDFGLRSNWMNTDVALQWRSGLPPGMNEDLSWRRYDGLNVGLAGRRGLIPLKLFAAVDDGPRGVHFQDLVKVRPTRQELDQAAQWVKTQDASSIFIQMVDEVVDALLQRISDEDEAATSE